MWQHPALLPRRRGRLTAKLADSSGKTVPTFLNRMLALPVQTQALLFSYFVDVMDALVQDAKTSGKFNDGIVSLSGVKVHPLSARPPAVPKEEPVRVFQKQAIWTTDPAIICPKTKAGCGTDIWTPVNELKPGFDGTCVVLVLPRAGKPQPGTPMRKALQLHGSRHPESLPLSWHAMVQDVGIKRKTCIHTDPLSGGRPLPPTTEIAQLHGGHAHLSPTRMLHHEHVSSPACRAQHEGLVSALPRGPALLRPTGTRSLGRRAGPDSWPLPRR